MPASKYTAARAKAICELIRKGVTVEGACESAGINPDTHYEWKKRYPDYAEQVTRANGQSEAELVEIARRGAIKDPRIAVQILERRFGGRWCKAEKHQVTANQTVTTVSPQLIKSLASLPESARNAPTLHTDSKSPTKTVSAGLTPKE